MMKTQFQNGLKMYKKKVLLFLFFLFLIFLFLFFSFNLFNMYCKKHFLIYFYVSVFF